MAVSLLHTVLSVWELSGLSYGLLHVQHAILKEKCYAHVLLVMLLVSYVPFWNFAYYAENNCVDWYCVGEIDTC